jgi:hypothetical protein
MGKSSEHRVGGGGMHIHVRQNTSETPELKHRAAKEHARSLKLPTRKKQHALDWKFCEEIFVSLGAVLKATANQLMV